MVVIWRATWSAEIDRIFDFCRKSGIVTIFDVDDLMFRPELARNVLIDGIRSQRLSELDVQRFYVRINQSVRAADLCTCTTDELASHLRLFKKPSFVVPNCWDEETWRRSRLAVRQRAQAEGDGLVRIGYASGTRTHQKDFAAAVAGAIARLLRENPECRLVLFRDPDSGEGIVIADEFDELADLHAQVEWRDKVALVDLAAEIARFDINLAPLASRQPVLRGQERAEILGSGAGRRAHRGLAHRSVSAGDRARAHGLSGRHRGRMVRGTRLARRRRGAAAAGGACGVSGRAVALRPAAPRRRAGLHAGPGAGRTRGGARDAAGPAIDDPAAKDRAASARTRDPVRNATRWGRPR